MDWNAVKSSAQALLNQEGLTVSGTCDGAPITGVKTILRRADVNTDMGLIEGRYTFSLLCPVTAFPTMPSPRRSKVVIDGVTYRVLSSEKDAIGATLRLNLGDLLQ